MNSTSAQTRWAIILAGGEGTRVRAFLQQLCGGRGIKQFCAVVGRQSMLEHTLTRVERRFPRDRILVVVSRDHNEEARRQLAHWPVENVIVQPRNRDTAPGILLPLAHISQRDPFATIAIFPSDHFILAEDQFMTAVDDAVRETQRFPQDLTLLGFTPDGLDDGYGWIELADEEEGRQTRAVRRFWEKPSLEQRHVLHEQAAVWNAFVCVGQARTLWALIRQTASELYADFRTIRQALDRPQATAVIEAVYEQMRPVNFSTAVCEQLPSRLRVFPVPDVGWSDWGSVERIMATVRRIGKLDEVLARLQRRGSESVCTNAKRSWAGISALHAPLNRDRSNTDLSVDPELAFAAARLSKGAEDEML